MRERWLGATGRKVPEIVVEGEFELPEGTLVLEGVDIEALREAFGDGRPVAVHADTAEGVKAALARPEVSCVIVRADHRELTQLDLRALTYD
ncbi:MAG: hypothetical protein ABWY51_05515 [Gaiellaceae bacterium]